LLVTKGLNNITEWDGWGGEWLSPWSFNKILSTENAICIQMKHAGNGEQLTGENPWESMTYLKVLLQHSYSLIKSSHNSKQHDRFKSDASYILIQCCLYMHHTTVWLETWILQN
jgi:hypothetical protein